MNSQVSTKPISQGTSDAIRAIFTGWLKTTSIRKKSSTITRYYKKHDHTVSLDELQDKPAYPHFELRDFSRAADYADLFQFTNARLENAFISLPERYQQVLVYYYVFELGTGDIANRLRLKTDILYNIKSRTLRKLRKDLSDGRETNR